MILYPEKSEFAQIGQIDMMFSEYLEEPQEISEHLNLTYLSTPDLFMNVSYIPYDKKQTYKSELTGWEVIAFTKSKLTLQLNFSEPLLVSSSIYPDQIEFKINEPRIFLKEKSGAFMTQKEAKDNILYIDLST